MRYYIMFTLFYLLITCFSRLSAQPYDITVKINYLKDTAAFLGYNFGDQKFVKDTALTENGNTLRFRGKENLPQGVYFVYSPSVYFEFLVSEQHFTLETDTLDFVKNLRIKGSRENQVFNDFQKYMAARQSESILLSKTLDSLRKLNDSIQVRNLEVQLESIGQEVKNYQQSVIQNNPGTFVAKLISAMQKPEIPEPPKNEQGEVMDKSWQFFYYKNHFFDHFDLADSGLLRSPVYQPKIDEYLEKLTYQHPDSISVAADYILSRAEPSREAYRYVLVKLTNKYETSNIMGMERVFVYLAENYYLKGKAYWADSSLVAKFEQRVKEVKPNLIGARAPDMNLLDTLLKPHRLSTLKNDYVILYFYDPDCGHCKKVTPELLKVYHNLKSKNVTVWAANITTDLNKWKDYIRKNELDWINVADPYLRSNFRADYDIKSTPSIFIINSKKEIIAKKLGVEQIEDFINRMIEFEKG